MLDLKTLYKLPYTKNNNPSGWIEPTSCCQLECPYCYRSTSNNEYQKFHRNLSDLKLEVDELIKQRNIQTLSIGGGEPLLYPELNEITRYARSKKLNVLIYTNGILINEKKVIELKEAGTSRIIIHIDIYQNRPEILTEDDVNKKRLYYCEIFRKAGGISLGFIKYISKENIDNLRGLAEICKNNADVIKSVVFTILNKTVPEVKKETDDAGMELDEKLVFAKIKNLFDLNYCAYLKKTESDKIAWLAAFMIYKNNKIIGCADGELVKLYQQMIYGKEGRYSFVSNENYFNLKILYYFISSSKMRKILYNFLTTEGKLKINEQFLLIMNTPHKENNVWHICDGCPDAMFYRGKLIPECLLNRIKGGEAIYIK